MRQPPFNQDPSQQWRQPPGGHPPQGPYGQQPPMPYPPRQQFYPPQPSYKQQPYSPPQQPSSRQEPTLPSQIPPVSPPQSKKPWYRRPIGVIGILIGAILLCGLCSILTNSTHSSPSPGSGTANIVATQPARTPTRAPVSNPTDTRTLAPASVPTATLAPKPTAMPTDTPTPKPAVKIIPPTPTVNTVKPTPAPVPQLSIAFTQASNELVSVHTLPGAALTIKVLYACSGHYSTSLSLQGTSYADSSGNHTWTWNNTSSCHGTVTATVTSSSGGKTVISSANFTD